MPKQPRQKIQKTALRRARFARGLTILDVSRETGIEAGGISRIERGLQHPNPKTAKKLFHFYNGSVPIEQILIPEDSYE